MIDWITEEISKNTSKRVELLKRYEEYKGNVPILGRVLPIENKINKKIAADFRGYIVDQFVGYVWGNPIAYQVSQGKKSELQYEQNKEELRRFRLENNIEDLDAEAGKFIGCCGFAARLLYNNVEGRESVMNVDPWECLFFYDEHGELSKSIRYYFVEGVMRVDVYDHTTIYSFVQKEKGLTFVEEQLHMFGYVPLFEIQNNKERMSDFGKVDTQIDAYDETNSDSQNEIEQFRLAYMAFYGAKITKETIEQARVTGAFGGLDQNAKIEFITKNINDTFLENHKRTLVRDIHKFSNTLDFSDENFAGNASGISMKYKMQGLQNVAIIKERKFKTGLRYMFKVLCSSWQKRKIDMDYLDITYRFTPNLPVDLEYQAEVATKFRGMISEDTRLSLLDVVEDVDQEREKMKEDEDLLSDIYSTVVDVE